MLIMRIRNSGSFDHFSLEQINGVCCALKFPFVKRNYNRYAPKHHPHVRIITVQVWAGNSSLMASNIIFTYLEKKIIEIISVLFIYCIGWPSIPVLFFNLLWLRKDELSSWFFDKSYDSSLPESTYVHLHTILYVIQRFLLDILKLVREGLFDHRFRACVLKDTRETNIKNSD